MRFHFVRSLFFSCFCTLILAEPKLHVVTVANYQNVGLERLLYTAKFFGITDVQIMGMNEPYPHHLTKLYQMLKFLEKTPEEDVALFIDAFDVILLGSKEEILERFLAFNAPCLFGSERNYHPKDSVVDLGEIYPESPTSLAYLNSGQYIGYCGYLKKMIKEALSNRFYMPLRRYYNRLHDDQYHFQRYFIKHQQEVLLDRHAAIFLPLTNVGRPELTLDLERRSILFNETQSYPLVIHGNGKGNVLLLQIYEELFPKTVIDHSKKKKK